MHVTKTVISHLEKNYALAALRCEGRDCFLAASELEERCLLFDRRGNPADVVWEKPGGVMSMVAVPHTEGQFLATLKFYGFNHAEAANISVVTRLERGNWEIRTLVELPFVHRIDILERGGVRWLLACTLKSGHEYDDDWRFPGKVYAMELPEDLRHSDRTDPPALTVLREGLLKNHGYSRTEQNGVAASLISAENGVFRLTPPETRNGEWTFTCLTEDPTSDAALADLDGDGEEELGVIAPFHGDRVRIYKPSDGGYRPVFEYPERLPFSHAFYCGPLGGGNALVVGQREGERDLLCFTWDAKEKTYRAERIDHGRGPANLLHYVSDGVDVLAAANRETDELALYRLEL